MKNEPQNIDHNSVLLPAHMHAVMLKHQTYFLFAIENYDIMFFLYNYRGLKHDMPRSFFIVLWEMKIIIDIG